MDDNLLIIALPSVLLSGIFAWVLIQARNRRGEFFQQELEKKGVVVHELTSADGNLSPFTRFWGHFDRPIPLFLTISNQHTMSRLSNVLGFGNLQVHDPEFDQEFLVRTNRKDFARRLLTPAIRKSFLNAPPSTFVTGSVESLLDSSYWPEDKVLRRWRNLWLFECPGHIKGTVEAQAILDLAKLINRSACDNIPFSQSEVKSDNTAYRATRIFNGDPLLKWVWLFNGLMLMLIPIFFVIVVLAA
ncbi:MAG: hypothetical protein KDD62_04035 [Bdellovibrionales bacterium]|nr:hypothetical protein [Bdellovibrionales bacterium]